MVIKCGLTYNAVQKDTVGYMKAHRNSKGNKWRSQ